MTGRRPRPVAVSGPTAWLIVAFMRRANEFQAWQLGIQHTGLVGPQEWNALHDDLLDLQQLANEYRDYRCSEAGTAEQLEPEPTAVLSHEITVREAADKLNVSMELVRRHCRKERLIGRREGREWRIDASSVELLQQGRVA